MFLSPQQEVALGQEAAPQFAQEFGGPYADPVIQEYVRGVGAKVAAQATSSEYPYQYSFTVLDSDVVNAFALPGGPIYITRGLLFQLSDESQLAGVLAHEVTHVAARHSAQQISRQMSVSVLISIASAALTRGKTGAQNSASMMEDVASLVANLADLRYSRKNETEADVFGLDYMVRAGYQPMGMVGVMQMFLKLERQAGSSGPEFLKTHPNPDNRVETLLLTIQEKYPKAPSDPRLIVGAQAYQEKVLSRRDLVKQYSKSSKSSSKQESSDMRTARRQAIGPERGARHPVSNSTPSRRRHVFIVH
jgi:predicted Zn-dependent protease